MAGVTAQYHPLNQGQRWAMERHSHPLHGLPYISLSVRPAPRHPATHTPIDYHYKLISFGWNPTPSIISCTYYAPPNSISTHEKPIIHCEISLWNQSHSMQRWRPHQINLTSLRFSSMLLKFHYLSMLCILQLTHAANQWEIRCRIINMHMISWLANIYLIAQSLVTFYEISNDK